MSSVAVPDTENAFFQVVGKCKIDSTAGMTAANVAANGLHPTATPGRIDDANAGESLIGIDFLGPDNAVTGAGLRDFFIDNPVTYQG